MGVFFVLSKATFIFFEELKEQLKNKLTNKKNCVSICINENQCVFLLAFEKDFYDKNILFIKEQIAKSILLFYKPKIIIKSIKNFDIKDHNNVILTHILSSFDEDEDKKQIIESMSLIKSLFLDSFVNFRLKLIKKRWTDVGSLINQNSLFLLDEKVKKELMQFLMDGIVPKIDFLELKKERDKIEFASDKKISEQKMFYSLYDYDNALFSIINNYPKKIVVENYKNFDVNFINILYELFGSKVKFT